MKLGFAISGRRPGPEVIEAARLAEGNGFDELWLTEDYCEHGAFALAGAVAASTNRIRVGLGVVNPWTRHPALTAMEFAGLDEVAGGRAVLGLGASNVRWMEDQLGIPFERPLGRLREAVTLLRSLLAGEQVNHDGDAYRVKTELSFPVLRPRPPISLGVKGRRALALAGEVADEVLLSVLSAPDYVRWAAEQVGAPLPIGALVAFSCDDDGEAARDALRPFVARFLGIHGDHDITRTAGLDPDLAQRFRDASAEGRPAVDLVTDELVATFAVSGSFDECVASFRRFRKAGVSTLIIYDNGDVDLSRLLQLARRCRTAAHS